MATSSYFSSLAGFLVLWSASAWAGPAIRIVSDLDDTVKVTNVQNKGEAARNGVNGRTPFAGMAELYRAWANDEAADFDSLTFLSGSPAFLREQIELFLGMHRFPSGPVILRNWFKDGFTGIDYKHRAMKRLGDRASAGPWILVGDDTEYDPEVYAQFEIEQAPKHVVAATYIRAVTGRAIADGQVSFQTAFGIAAREWSLGRLSEAAAIRVGRETLKAPSHEFRPYFVRCAHPTSAVPGLTPELTAIDRAVARRWSESCARRFLPAHSL